MNRKERQTQENEKKKNIKHEVLHRIPNEVHVSRV